MTRMPERGETAAADDLRSRLVAALEENRHLTPEAQTEVVLRLLERELDEPCRDRDCIRRRKHPRLARHLWKHSACPPLNRGLFGWTCFACGKRIRHRIHRVGDRS
jgi:hypothetical protein